MSAKRKEGRERDPKVDPAKGDRIDARGFHFRIDYVEKGRVYYARFKESEDTADQLSQMSIDEWRTAWVEGR